MEHPMAHLTKKAHAPVKKAIKRAVPRKSAKPVKKAVRKVAKKAHVRKTVALRNPDGTGIRV